MGQYWTRKGDQEDLDEKTVCPWADAVAGGNRPRILPHYRVVCAVVEHEGRILCMQKPVTKYAYTSLHWEFPGGKVEEGESNEEALRRELLEEMDYEVEVGDFIGETSHTYPDFSITLTAYRCTAKTRQFTMKEHADYRWCTPEEMKELNWCEADAPLLDMIQARVP